MQTIQLSSSIAGKTASRYLLWRQASIGEVIGAGVTIPPDGSVGYMQGSKFLRKDSTGNYIYVNTGTYDSSAFKLLTGVDLTGLTATAAVLNARVTGHGIRYLIPTSIVLTTAYNGKEGIITAAGGATVTLPAATGSFSIYRFSTQGTITVAAIVATDGTAVFKGTIFETDNVSAAVTAYSTTTLKNVTFDGAGLGVAGGDYITCIDIATNVYSITGQGTSSTGASITPFS